MAASTLVTNIDGVKGLVIGDTSGRVLEQVSAETSAETLVAVTAFVGDALVKAGQTLGIGTPQVLSVKTLGPWWVVAWRTSNVIAVRCESNRAATSVETTLMSNDWETLIEAPAENIEDFELESVPPSERVPRPSPPANPVPKPAEVRADKPTRVAAPSRGTILRQAPVPNKPTLPRVASSIQEAGALAHTESLLAELRRALVKGQLKQAEIVAAELSAEPRSKLSPAESGPIPPALLEGIAMVLAGDALGGLANLKEVESTSTKAPSLRWAALVWCARACSAAGMGLEVADAYAQSALRIAGQLDGEARAVSTVEQALVAFHQSKLGEALELTHTARALLESTSDPQLLASCWLLEARVLAAIGNHAESIGAARHAREQRPSWPPPATFIARRALHEGHLEDARGALQGLLAQKPTATEVERTHRIIEYVRAGATPPQAAVDFLELVDAPPSPENIRRLEELSEKYPKIAHFRDAFGWQLLRAGQYDSASVIFERLGTRGDLAEDVRSSVLLALACLAAAASRHARPGTRVRAAVDAAPKDFKSAKPVPPSSGKMRAAPIEFRISDLPPQLASSAGTTVENPRKSAGTGHGGPVFSGNLQLFALPDLLEFLRSGQRTGTLLCSSTAGIGAIHMRRGRITGAASPNTKGLRDYLVAMGVVTRESLQKVASPTADAGLIGGVLVRMGLVTPEHVRIGLRDQVRDAVKELISWGAGQFAFDPEAVTDASPSDIDVDFDPQEVLLNIFREMDENTK